MAGTNYIGETFKAINDSKEGGNFHAEIKYKNSTERGKAINVVCVKTNTVALDLGYNRVAYTWVGSPIWYKSQNTRKAYNRSSVEKLLLNAVAKVLGECNYKGNKLKILYPQYITDITEEYDIKTGEASMGVKNLTAFVNKIFPVVSKFE